MRSNCERCQTATLAISDSYICIHECTFCFSCANEMHFICPNCTGELVRRPKPAVRK
ncbi:DUF1272 domain-containing protein [Bacillus sp. JCM 19041]|uniref:DUF1272 domain-containing protein n=1 Tax=Bacillus sp. JCM 19041 TaxID=1460637 RepID=UPI00336A1949